MTTEIKANEQYFPFGTIYYAAVKRGLNFESVDKDRKCEYPHESYCAVLSCGTFYYAVQGGSDFSVCG